MESSSVVELKVISCQNLKAFNFFQKLSVYAVVSIVSDDPDNKKQQEQQQQQRTPVDRDGDGNPEWNHEMRFNLKETTSFQLADWDHLFIHFDLRSEGLLVFGDKSIGEVRVPFKDLIQDSSNGAVRFVSYEIRTPDAKPNGVLNFSCKVVVVVVNENGKGKQSESGSPGPETTHITGFPIIHDHSPEEIHHPSPQQLHYPSLDLQNPSHQNQLHYPSSQYPPSQASYYPPPEIYYLPPPPPPPPPLWPPPPPPPPVAHGAFYHPPPPPWGYPRPPDDPYTHWRGNPAVGQLNAFDSGETWPNDLGAGGDRHVGSWNGR